MFCKGCGRELDDDELFCANCGTRSELKEEESDAKTGKSKKVYISLIIGIVIAIAFIAFIASLYITAPSAPSSNKETAQTQESNSEDTTPQQAEEPATTQSKYILENSATKELTEADIAGLSDDEICKAQNEIWARHGRKFKNNWLQDYFNNQSWYSGTIEADEFLSKYSPTDVENKNAQFLNSALSSRGYDLNKAHPNGTQTTSATVDVAALTQQIKDDGYNMVVQGEVKLHAYQSGGRTWCTYYVRLNNEAFISGYQAQEFSSKSTRTICASSSTSGTFASSYDIEKYFAELTGHQVLVGFMDGSNEIQFATGPSCNFENHSQSECDLMNAGPVTFITRMEVKDLG